VGLGAQGCSGQAQIQNLRTTCGRALCLLKMTLGRSLLGLRNEEGQREGELAVEAVLRGRQVLQNLGGAQKVLVHFESFCIS
jgi:hypothetical protein